MNALRSADLCSGHMACLEMPAAVRTQTQGVQVKVGRCSSSAGLSRGRPKAGMANHS